MTNTFQIRKVDYLDDIDAKALVELLNHYAQDSMGGSEAIPEPTLARVCTDLAQRPYAFSFIVWVTSDTASTPVGLVNCFESYSTFKAKPLINIHDIVIHRDWRGKGLSQLLMRAVEREAYERGSCKLTLEVLSGNRIAQQSYQKFGFMPYVLDPAAGNATLMQKWL